MKTATFIYAWNDSGLILTILGGLVLLAVILTVVKLVNKKGKRKKGMVHNKPKKNDEPKKNERPPHNKK
ncbi:hypothetical protein [uncultured Marixanthomonas sp.]|uniref:hypothetical protein n=1 Tax=uncultured Marixanthomonas sp. TaxID=757245 RepID=UPI0030D91887|tara:strand:- start:16979 stop:17185 length:207 start_codon:yes stop_codon:yes gene_type:complete